MNCSHIITSGAMPQVSSDRPSPPVPGSCSMGQLPIAWLAPLCAWNDVLDGGCALVSQVGVPHTAGAQGGVGGSCCAAALKSSPLPTGSVPSNLSSGVLVSAASATDAGPEGIAAAAAALAAFKAFRCCFTALFAAFYRVRSKSVSLQSMW